MSDQKRETLKVKNSTRQQIAENDWQSLLKDEKFLRVLFTMLEVARMFTGNFQPDQRTHAFFEGRRSWGLDILRTAEKYLGRSALQRMIEAEMKTPQEAPNDRSGYTEQRRNELGGDDGNDVNRDGQVQYLDYSG